MAKFIRLLSNNFSLSLTFPFYLNTFLISLRLCWKNTHFSRCDFTISVNDNELKLKCHCPRLKCRSNGLVGCVFVCVMSMMTIILCVRGDRSRALSERVSGSFTLSSVLRYRYRSWFAVHSSVNCTEFFVWFVYFLHRKMKLAVINIFRLELRIFFFFRSILFCLFGRCSPCSCSCCYCVCCCC